MLCYVTSRSVYLSLCLILVDRNGEQLFLLEFYSHEPETPEVELLTLRLDLIVPCACNLPVSVHTYLPTYHRRGEVR